MPVPAYRFKARTDLPDLGLNEGECLWITPSDKEFPLTASRKIDITPAQFFDAIMGGTLQPDHCPHDYGDNPIYAIRNAMRWPWQDPESLEAAQERVMLTQDEVMEAVYHAALRVLPDSPDGTRESTADQLASLVAPELVRMGYRVVGPKPAPRSNGGLKLEAG